MALDCALTVEDRKAMLTKNTLFDALAQHWSRQYRRARRRGARVSYDMRRETVERALRELLAVVRFDTLWGLVAGRWSRAALNPLFSIRRISKDGHPLGYRVEVMGTSALRSFEDAIEADGQYRRRQKWPLLLADDWTPRHRQIRQHVCEEQPYNVVSLGEASERVLSILEDAAVAFHVETFRDDYETLSAYLKSGHRPSTRAQWRNYRKLVAFVARYRRVYRQTETIPVEGFTYEVWEQWGDRPGDGDYRDREEAIPRTA